MPADDRRSAALRRSVEIAAPATVASARAIFLPVAVGVVAAAMSGLPLFQDGSSYLLELLLTHSAVRHHRLSVVLLQIPTRAMMRTVGMLHLGDSRAVPLVRLAFAASYAAVPLVALGLSWLIVRRRRPDLLVWPALVILFVNLVNFSWVSELLIGIQLSCPLLLATVLLLGTPTYWLLTALLLPIVWLLHPLLAPLFLVIAVAAAQASRHTETLPAVPSRQVRSAARWTIAMYVVAALLRVVVSLLSLTKYESGFTGGDEMRTYLFATSWQNAAFLTGALAIACACWRAKALRATQRRLAYRGSVAIATAAAILLMSQYLVGSGAFPLKTGLTLFVTSAVLFIAMLDSRTPASADETRERVRLAAMLALVFAVVVVAKSLLWHSAVTRVVATLATARASCVETVADDFVWLHRAPYTIVDNWALPSLALVVQDARPRRLLLERGDCAAFFASGAVRVDPWTVIPAHAIVPPLD
jgi:hypothetical protein